MPKAAPAQLTELPDLELIELVRAGDEHAYAQLWSRHYPAALTAARNISFSHDPEDLVQESFAAILQALRNGNGPTQGFRPYMYATIRSVSQNWSNKSAPTSDIDDHVDSLYELSDLSEDSANRGLTVNAFAALPEEWRTVLWYTEVEGMTPAEVAPLLGMTAKSVAALSFRARNGLRESWLAAHTAAPSADAGPECAWATKQFAPYLRDSLTARRTTRLQDHLVACYLCSAAFAELTEVNRDLRGILLPIFLGVSAAALSKAGLIGVGTAAPLLVGGAAKVDPSTWNAQNKPAIIGTSVGASALIVAAIVAAFALQTPPPVAAPSQTPSAQVSPTVTAPVSPSTAPPATTPTATVPPATIPPTTAPAPSMPAKPFKPVAPTPTAAPSPKPTVTPTPEPTVEPTTVPTVAPTSEPSVEPTVEPTVEPPPEPTPSPTATPTPEPTVTPTAEPTPTPTPDPTSEPVPEVAELVVNTADHDGVLLPRVSGTGQPGATIEILSANVVVANGTVDDQGDWDIVIKDIMLPAGQNSLTFTARQIARSADGTPVTSAPVDIVQVNGDKVFNYRTPSWSHISLDDGTLINSGDDLTHTLSPGAVWTPTARVYFYSDQGNKTMRIFINGVKRNTHTGSNQGPSWYPEWDVLSPTRQFLEVRFEEGTHAGPSVEFWFNLILN